MLLVAMFQGIQHIHHAGEPAVPSGYVSGGVVNRLVFWPVHRLSSYSQSTTTSTNRLFVGSTAIIGINKQFYETSSFTKNYTPRIDGNYWTAYFNGKITPPNWRPAMYFKGGWKLDSTTNLNNSSTSVQRPRMAVWNDSVASGEGYWPSPFAANYTISSFTTLSTLKNNVGHAYGGGGSNAGYEAKYLGPHPTNNLQGLFAIKGSIAVGVLKDLLGKNVSGLANPSFGLTTIGGYWQMNGTITYTANNGSKGSYSYSNYNITSATDTKNKLAEILMDAVGNSYTPPIHVYDEIMKIYTKTGNGA
jgi:hypothetical protein